MIQNIKESKPLILGAIIILIVVIWHSINAPETANMTMAFFGVWLIAVVIALITKKPNARNRNNGKGN